MSSVLCLSGKLFDYLAPAPAMFDLNDAAHGLAVMPRFLGQTRVPYDVATHSVFVSYLVPPNLAFEGLNHDGHEYLVCDIPAPLKALLPDYRALEDRVESAWRAAMGLRSAKSLVVKYWDRVACIVESRRLRDCDPLGSEPVHLREADRCTIDPLRLCIDVGPARAFLNRWWETVSWERGT